LDGVRGDPKTECHIVVNSSIRQRIFDQYDLMAAKGLLDQLA